MSDHLRGAAVVGVGVVVVVVVFGNEGVPVLMVEVWPLSVYCIPHKRANVVSDGEGERV